MDADEKDRGDTSLSSSVNGMRRRVFLVAVAGVWMGRALPSAGADAKTALVNVSMVAYEASEARKPRTAPRQARGYAAPPRFDKKRTIARRSAVAPFKKETELVITDRYTLCITPLGKDDRGRIRINARIDESVKVGKKTIKRKALETTSAVAPNKTLTLGGPKLTNGKLLVKLTVTE